MYLLVFRCHIYQYRLSLQSLCKISVQIQWLYYIDLWTDSDVLGLLQRQSDIGHALKNILAMDGVRGECIWYFISVC